MQHREWDREIARDLALVAGLATLDAGPEVAARPPVRPQNIVKKEGRNIGETGSEKRGDISGRFGAVDAFLESDFHRRVGQEGLAHRFTGCERRRAKNNEAARVGKVRRHFERDMTAETPPDEMRLVDLQRIQDRANGARMAGKRIGVWVFRIVRRAMAGKIDRDQAKALAKRPVELTGKTREDDELPWMSTTGGPRPADSWTAIAPFGVSTFRVFIASPPKNSNGLGLVLEPAAQPLPKVASDWRLAISINV